MPNSMRAGHWNKILQSCLSLGEMMTFDFLIIKPKTWRSVTNQSIFISLEKTQSVYICVVCPRRQERLGADPQVLSGR
jgi:hypothetical protein